MNISSVRAGDIVEVDIRGTKFIARVEEFVKIEGKQSSLKIMPFHNASNRYSCKANEVIGHYKKMNRTRAARNLPNGETLQAV